MPRTEGQEVLQPILRERRHLIGHRLRVRTYGVCCWGNGGGCGISLLLNRTITISGYAHDLVKGVILSAVIISLHLILSLSVQVTDSWFGLDFEPVGRELDQALVMRRFVCSGGSILGGHVGRRFCGRFLFFALHRRLADSSPPPSGRLDDRLSACCA
jgi:hypothetical protein